MKNRCPWSGSDPLLVAYHDSEWGVPLHDDRGLFEFLTLEGAQAGLSWMTVLKKRDHYRRVFSGFDPQVVAALTPADVDRLLSDPGIIRNRLKVESVITNARCVLEILDAFGSLDAFLWRFVDGRPIQNGWRSPAEWPSRSEISDRLSRELKARGFRFVGSTICYAFMQATGMVNDHLADCFRFAELRQPPHRAAGALPNPR